MPNLNLYGASTRLQFILLTGLTLLPLASLFILAMIFAFMPISRGVDEMMFEIKDRMIPVYRLQVAMHKASMPPNDYLIAGIAAEHQEFRMLTREVDSLFQVLKAEFPENQDEANKIEQLRKKWLSAKVLGEDLFKLTVKQDQSYGAEMERFDSAIDMVSMDFDSFVRQAEDHFDEDLEELSKLKKIGLNLVAMGFLLALILGIGGGFWLTRDRRTLREKALKDPLTGIYNRLGFEQYLTGLIEASISTDKPRFTIVLFDGDRFKLINDTCGHLVGDEVLRNLSMIVRQQLRDTDYFARLGGDEFIFLFHDMDQSSVYRLCERIRLAVEDSPMAVTDGQAVFMTISLGHATFPEDADSASLLMQAADKAMYASKAKGGNRTFSYQEISMQQEPEEKRREAAN